MKKCLNVAVRGIKGGAYKTSRVGDIHLRLKTGDEPSQRILDVDLYQGIGSSYFQREQPIITVYNLQNSMSAELGELAFTGTHDELVELIWLGKKTKRNTPSKELTTILNLKINWTDQEHDQVKEMVLKSFEGKFSLGFHRIHNHTDIDNHIGLAYTSSFSVAGLWICNLDVQYDKERRYVGFVLDEQGDVYALLWTVEEKESYVKIGTITA